jgi:MFS transporter, SET family, sugar efflux transporter
LRTTSTSHGDERAVNVDTSWIREVAPLVGATGAYGIISAFLSTTTSLFLADAVHAEPLFIGLFFAGRGLAAIAVSLVAGWISDRLPDRRIVILFAGAAGAVGGVAFAVLRSYPAVLIVGVSLFAVADLCFPQIFAYAKELTRARGRRDTAFTTTMRSLFSAAWVVGPPMGFLLLTHTGFGTLYLTVSGLSLVIVLCARWGLPRLPLPPRADDPAAGREAGLLRGLLLAVPWRTWLLLGAVVCLGVANQVYNINIALHVTKNLHLGAQVVGWMAGLAAVLEIPIMIVVGRFADRLGKLRVMLASAIGGTLFFWLLPLAGSIPQLLALQLLNAAWTAVMLSIPMVMVQQEARSKAGAATALYTSAFMFAVLLAGLVAGLAATSLGYRDVFWVCVATCIAAGGLLAARAIGKPNGGQRLA